MIFIFPHDYFDKHNPEEFYQKEFELVENLNCEYVLIDFDKVLAKEDPFSTTCEYNRELAVWRGWQMPSDTYSKFYDFATDHGLKLINIPNQYRACHELSNSYGRISRYSMSTIFADFEKTTPSSVRNILELLDAEKVFVKDTVKGQRDYPCIIEATDDDKTIQSKLDKLVADRGDSFTGTFAFRRFVELKGETRFFILDGAIVGCGRHFSDFMAIKSSDAEKIATALGQKSRFFTVDMALAVKTGETIVVETGDGQVSECPKGCREQVIRALSRISE